LLDNGTPLSSIVIVVMMPALLTITTPPPMVSFVTAIIVVIIAALIIFSTWLIDIYRPRRHVDISWLLVNGYAKREINPHMRSIVIRQRNAWYR